MLGWVVLAMAGLGMGDLAGRYDGGQTEIAAGLELAADGHFRYGLSYGALDERASGRWSVEDGRVVLHGDPVNPPRFVETGRSTRSDGPVRVTLETPPGIDSGYFDAIAEYGDHADRTQFRDGVAELQGSPDAVVIALEMFGVASDPIGVGTGMTLSVRFEPNDLGTVDFRDTALPVEDGALILERHGRTLRFRRESE